MGQAVFQVLGAAAEEGRQRSLSSGSTASHGKQDPWAQERGRCCMHPSKAVLHDDSQPRGPDGRGWPSLSLWDARGTAVI